MAEKVEEVADEAWAPESFRKTKVRRKSSSSRLPANPTGDVPRTIQWADNFLRRQDAVRAAGTTTARSFVLLLSV